MTSGTTLKKTQPARVMLVGYPGGGKTGALACLANAGYKLRILDYDGNLAPLLLYTDQAGLANIDAISLEDNMRMGARFVEAEGIPSAFINGFKALDRWKYVDPETKQEVDLGASADWGLDTIVVLDSLTAMGRCAFARARKLMNKTPLDTTDATWGLAMKEQEAFIERLTSSDTKHHVVVTAHLKMIGPRDVRKGDSSLTQELKERTAELVKTRLFPSALGWALPQTIGEHFPTLLEVRAKYLAGKSSRVIQAIPRPELDLKLPARLTEELTGELPIADGLLKVFDAVTGGVENCLKAGQGAPLGEKEGSTT